MNNSTMKALAYSLRLLLTSLFVSLSVFVVMVPYAVNGLYLQPAIQTKMDRLVIEKTRALNEVGHGDTGQE